MKPTYRCSACKKQCNCKKVKGRFVSYCCEGTLIEEYPMVKAEPGVVKKIEAERSQDVLIDTLNRIGLDAESVGKRMLEAMEMCLKRTKFYKIRQGGDTEVKEVPDPDMENYRALLAMWGQWMKIGRGHGGSIGNTTFNFSGLDNASRERVGGIIEALENEAKRRGLPNLLPGGSEIKDAETLPGMVDPGGEPEVVDRGAP